MKLKFNFDNVILCFISIQIIINIIYPNTAYAMSPEDIQEISNNLYDAKDMIPKNYWMNHMNEKDVYALQQKSVYFNNKPFLVESTEYPIVLDSTHLNSNSVSNIIEYKSKFLWYVWKKYSNQFNSFDQYKRSIDNSFSIRNELKKAFKSIK